MYNFIYVYPREFDSNGALAKSVATATSFGLLFFQLCMCGLFGSLFKLKWVTQASMFIVIIEVLWLLSLLYWDTFFPPRVDE